MSIKLIARLANVSAGTVDRVIHNRGRVSQETKEKVQKIISELNYKPNLFAKNLSLSRTYRFGVLMPELNQDSQYWKIPAQGINHAQADLEIYKVEIDYFHYNRYSEDSFKSTFNNILKQNLDGLLIAPVLSSAADQVIDSIPKDLPYSFFDSTLPKNNCLSYVGQDSYQSGFLAGKLMKLLTGKTADIAVLKMLPEDFHINERIRGFHNYLDSENIQTINIYEIDSSLTESQFDELFEKIIKENVNLKGFFVSNAWTHPIARYLKSASLQDSIHVIGYDLISENIKYLEEGVIDFIISQRPEMQGYYGIYSLFRHIVLKEKVEEKNMMPLDIITKENLKYFRD